jgi:ferredoxin
MPITFVHEEKIIGSVEDLIPKLNLLAHAQLIELLIGSRCGGHGICGGDLLRIELADQRAFFSLPSEIEREKLSENDLQKGMRLACQCYPNQNDKGKEIVIEVLSIHS